MIDSIYGDLPMTRVKFDARQEYQYLDNFKILQKAFKQHQIDKVRFVLSEKPTHIAYGQPIPVDRLVKSVERWSSSWLTAGAKCRTTSSSYNG